MKDLGIQPRVIDAARDFVKRAPDSSLAPHVRKLVTLATTHGLFDPVVADAADDVFVDLQEIDVDRDGNISSLESPHSREADELYSALLENDRDGDGSLSDEVLEQSVGFAKPSATPHVVGFCEDIHRRVVVLTLWSSRGARYAFEKSRATIERVRPDVVLIHTDPLALANGGGAQLTRDIRAAYPWLRVGWAFYGDSYGPNPVRAWSRCARAAEASHVATLMPNCETAWKSSKRGTHVQRNVIARECMNALRANAPTRHISFTSFDGWVNVPWKRGRWGGHEDMPVAGFLGDGSPCLSEAGQVYIGASDTGDGATYEAAVDRFARHELSRRAAVKKRLIALGVEAWTYAQAHSSRASAVCYLATRRRVTVFWAAPTRVDERGVAGMAASSQLARMLNERGDSMTVKEFQARHGLDPDDKMGVETMTVLARLAS